MRLSELLVELQDHLLQEALGARRLGQAGLDRPQVGAAGVQEVIGKLLEATRKVLTVLRYSSMRTEMVLPRMVALLHRSSRASFPCGVPLRERELDLVTRGLGMGWRLRNRCRASGNSNLKTFKCTAGQRIRSGHTPGKKE